MGLTELAGFVGAGLAAAAYVPQISHLIRAHCSAGLSRLAFGVWLTSSLLVTSHAVAMGAWVFIALGGTQIVATALIMAYTVKYEHSPCVSHRASTMMANIDERSANATFTEVND